MVIDIANFNFDGGSGGSVSGIDFSSIGYDAEFSAELNANINDDVAYSKKLYDDWDPSNTSARDLYQNDTKLIYAPNINTSNVSNMSYMFTLCRRLQTVPMYDTSKVNNMVNMFSYCSSLQTVPLFDTSNVTSMTYMFYECFSLTSVPLFNTSKVTDMSNMFVDCSKLTKIPAFNTSKVTDMYGMFDGCRIITSVPEMDTSNVTRMEYMFKNCSSLTKIEGISFKSFSDSTMSYSYLVGYGTNQIRKAVFKDIGYQSTAVQFNAETIDNWGVNSDEIPDARQSLIDSLITYSFDRLSAGYPTCEIKLSSNTKALLTEDEKAQIAAKGFTIA